jgi:hypothetical protein
MQLSWVADNLANRKVRLARDRHRNNWMWRKRACVRRLLRLGQPKVGISSVGDHRGMGRKERKQ